MTALAPHQRQFAIDALKAVKAINRNRSRRIFYDMFPDEDTPGRDGEMNFSRHKYPKQMEFFEAGAQYRERCFMAANRVGKSVAGGYETTSHLTGLYQDWWAGRRFSRNVKWWAAGQTNETTRDIVQTKLLGPVVSDGKRKAFEGTGMIPGALIGPATWKQGIQDLADTVKIKHTTGRWSTLGFKSYQQGMGSFMGTEQDGIWLDEECPEDVYGECLIRTATTNGIVLTTFTPLDGMTDVVMSFLPEDMRPQVEGS